MAPPQSPPQIPQKPTTNPTDAAAAAAAARGETETELDRLGTELNTCLMAQYAFTVVGLAVGTALGVQRKSLLPLVGAGAVGSLGDLVYGLGYACKPRLDAYRACRERVQPPRPKPGLGGGGGRPSVGGKGGNGEER